MTPGSHVKLTAEATGQAEISDVIITSSQSDVCLVEEDEEYDDCYQCAESRVSGKVSDDD